MYALVDCNSFFASCEKVFHPGLKGKPVCVLSNNDGCIVALTPEAKALGLRRGDAAFKQSELIRRNGVSVFSNNMVLYAAMSRRITSILRQSIERVESYSIDECFCDLRGYEQHYRLDEFMRGIAEKIGLWTDIPVSVGIAPTKTLAKIGSKFAKKYSAYRSVCMIDNEQKRRKALSLIELEDVWGLGPATCRRLKALGVGSALEFADRPLDWVRRHFNKPGEQTWMELNGIPCIDTTEIACRNSITTSRSFGKMIESLGELKECTASFAASCAGTLRSQNSLTGMVSVFVCSNRMREDLEQYWNIGDIRFFSPTSDTIQISQAAIKLVERLYKPGILYKKAGVILRDISAERLYEPELFESQDLRESRIRLSRTLDDINVRYGPKTVSLAVEGYTSSTAQSWRPRQEQRSRDYLTSLDDLLTVND